MGAIVAGVAGLAAVAAVLVGLTVAAPWLTAPPRTGTARARLRHRLDAAAGDCVAALGRPVTAAVVVLAGLSVTIGVSWALGLLAQALEGAVDQPVFAWFAARQVPAWSHPWSVLTHLGNRHETQLLTVVGAVVIAALWWRRRWWVPLLVLPTGYLFEKVGQHVLRELVDRGHPPGSLGSWISGGCARLVIGYGLVVLLLLRWRPPRGVRARAACWSVVAFLAAVEAYSRVYLLKHWFTDVLGGLLYGALGLAVLTAAVAVFDRRPAPDA